MTRLNSASRFGVLLLLLLSTIAALVDAQQQSQRRVSATRTRIFGLRDENAVAEWMKSLTLRRTTHLTNGRQFRALNIVQSVGACAPNAPSQADSVLAVATVIRYSSDCTQFFTGY